MDGEANQDPMNHPSKRFYRAVFRGESAEVLQLCQDYDKEVFGEKWGRSLKEAVLKGHLDVVQILVAAGADINAVDSDLAELKLLFVPLRVICIWKLDRWDEFDAESLRTTEAKLKNILAQGSERDLGQMLSGAALGLLAEHRGDRKQQIEYFVTANRCRPGTYEQINGEWIAEKVVQLLSDAGQTDRLEELLRQDVEHRDTLPKIHPERAFTRIRLAQLLAREGRDLDEAHDLLAEAKKVYSIHGDWIPAKEHKSLEDLQRTVESLHRE